MAQCDEFDLFMMLHGGLPMPLKIGNIPETVRAQLRWPSTRVLLSYGTAQKIRFHPDHPLPFAVARWAPYLVEHGNMFEDEGSLICYDLIPHVSKHFLYLVAKPGYPHHGIFVRTMYVVEYFRIKKKLRSCRPLSLKAAEAA
jgi:hypothetical protein